MSATGEEKFQLTIRCAMQSFSDHNVECPVEWSVLQLKEHLSRVCPSKPDPARQRLIYAGHCLENRQTLRDVLMQRRDGIVRIDPADKQVIHMVHIGAAKTQQSSTTTSTNSRVEGLRHRNVAAAPDITTTLNGPSLPAQSPPSMMFLPQQQQYNFPAYPPETNPLQQQSYEAWMAAYQNYMNQMMMAAQYGQMPYASSPLMQGHQMGQPSAAGAQAQPAAAFFFNGHQLMAAQQQQPPNGGDALAAAVPEREEVIGIHFQAVMPDFLDILYKSIRFVLLAMVLYLYSSFERFVFVLAIVALFWLVHRRRNQQQQERQQQQQRAEQQLQQQQQQQQRDDQPPQPQNAEDGAAEDEPNNNAAAVGGGAELGDGPPPPAQLQQQQALPSAWNVFFTVIQSFFTSLVPNPAPAPFDLN